MTDVWLAGLGWASLMFVCVAAQSIDVHLTLCAHMLTIFVHTSQAAKHSRVAATLSFFSLYYPVTADHPSIPKIDA
jgi:hypothetical protein